MKPKTIIVVILIVLALVIILQNTEVVTLRFLFWDLSMSRVILIPLLMLVGFVLGYIVTTVRGDRR
jgi:uncharacterized integral membrane protein